MKPKPRSTWKHAASELCDALARAQGLLWNIAQMVDTDEGTAQDSDPAAAARLRLDVQRAAIEGMEDLGWRLDEHDRDRYRTAEWAIMDRRAWLAEREDALQ